MFTLKTWNVNIKGSIHYLMGTNLKNNADKNMASIWHVLNGLSGAEQVDPVQTLRQVRDAKRDLNHLLYSQDSRQIRLCNNFNQISVK
jgi:hypothetical protein